MLNLLPRRQETVKCFCKDGSPRTRACSNSAKEERRSAILKAAAHLFSVREYREVSIDDVARGAGLAKGTVYLYFKTKETLFLELCADAFRGWFNALETGFFRRKYRANRIGIRHCFHAERPAVPQALGRPPSFRLRRKC